MRSTKPAQKSSLFLSGKKTQKKIQKQHKGFKKFSEERKKIYITFEQL